MALTASINTINKTKSEILFDAYEKFNQDNTIKEKDINNFLGFIKKENINLDINELIIRDIYGNLSKPEEKNNLIELLDKIDNKGPEIKEEEVQKSIENTKKFYEEKEETDKQTNEEKTMQMDDLMNKLKDKPENAEKNAEKIVETAKTRLKQTIERYSNKIKTLNTANDTEKETLKKELETIKAELKKEKESYEKAKKDFFEDIGNNYKDFSKEEIKKLPIRLVHYKQREGLFNRPNGFNSISAIRRRKTINTLIKKCNKIGKDHKDGVRFVMNFHKGRLFRYSDIKLGSAIDKLGGNMGLQMNPQQFHEIFNTGKKEINNVLRNPNAGELEPNEEKLVTAIENRINYYGAAYAKERANARVGPFIETEKNADQGAKIIQMNTAPKAAAA